MESDAKIGQSLHLVRIRTSNGKETSLRIHCAQVLNAPILGDTTFGLQMPPDDVPFYTGLHLVSKNISFPKLTAVSRKRTKRNKRLSFVLVNAPL